MYYIMSFIRKLASWMLLVLLLKIAVYYICRRRCLSKTAVYKMVFAAYLAGLFSQTIFPVIEFGILSSTGKPYLDIYFRQGSLAGVNLFPFRTILEQLTGRNEYLGAKDIFVNAVTNFAGNICLFVPVGFLLPEISKRFRDVRNALAVCLAISAFIEIIQFFTGRSMDVDDIILNSLGAVGGWLFWRLVYHCRRAGRKF